ncbi:MAG: hypothetical protein AAGA55_01410 [Planctomycetota bacterium]
MGRTFTNARVSAVGLAACLVGIVVSGSACREKRAPRAETIDPATAAMLGLTEDSRDPTELDKEAGYYFWKRKPEPEGTSSPVSPDRRKIGGPNP